MNSTVHFTAAANTIFLAHDGLVSALQDNTFLMQPPHMHAYYYSSVNGGE